MSSSSRPSEHKDVRLQVAGQESRRLDTKWKPLRLAVGISTAAILLILTASIAYATYITCLWTRARRHHSQRTPADSFTWWRLASRWGCEGRRPTFAIT